ncbi:hypothetical protein F503_05591 [Ophiostoma piceae UAMH 11346]|uniref:Uncharacterized protein n=1 Tax=Ophiostoma piceae (strain UAMH 11346) TaxID=1262450 RepID=S3CEH5_OPHP1|nr:hypothetical protein F503_05591 [Ophiostoma piceae UAMH 11346]
MAIRPGICGTVWRRQSVAVPPVRWLVLGACFSTGRAFSARTADGDGSVNHVFVRCKSSGSMIISLYNVFEHPPTTPLLLYLPPSPQSHIKATEDFEGDVEAQPASYTDDLASPPDYLLRQNIPIVSIRYRWSAAKIDEASSETAKRDARTKVPPLTHIWPTPLHDVMFAYDWIQKHLAPPPVEVTKPGRARRPSFSKRSRMQPRRDLYVYGSHLGASLATSLALTESYRDRHMAIRGVAAYNGIYNWTAFVKMAADGIPVADNATTIKRIAPGTPSLSSLFATPADLFDTFLSPCLFFRTPGLVVPPVDFDEEVNRTRIEEAELRLEQMEDRAALDVDGVPIPKRETSILIMGMSQKSYLAFPPMQSTLTIPPALLMHTLAYGEADAVDHSTNSKPRPRKIPEAVHGRNSYAAQADEMASLLRRGIDRYELKRKKAAEQIVLPEYKVVENDNEADSRSTESERRVQQVGIGASPKNGSLELGEKGQKILLGWLSEHMKKAGKNSPKL